MQAVRRCTVGREFTSENQTDLKRSPAFDERFAPIIRNNIGEKDSFSKKAFVALSSEQLLQ